MTLILAAAPVAAAHGPAEVYAALWIGALLVAAGDLSDPLAELAAPPRAAPTRPRRPRPALDAAQRQQSRAASAAASIDLVPSFPVDQAWRGRSLPQNLLKEKIDGATDRS
jgi:hypothetical protein